ncbi:hypothetical protein F5146DRAFT_999152 [Armillaria mellea]|nr:hypothetical protein F5146DRAFT_999152 [Armillaria mellea]
MGSSSSKPTFVSAGPTIAPGADPNLNPRRDLNVTRPWDMGSLLQSMKPNTYIDGLQTYFSQKPRIVIGGGVFTVVLFLMVVVMIYMVIKKRKAALKDRRRIVVLSQSGKEPEGYHDEVISPSYV